MFLELLSGQAVLLSEQPWQDEIACLWTCCPDRERACPNRAVMGENCILEMLLSHDQQLQSMSVCGLIELKLCKDVHDT
jgi:hypothetical protein